MRTPDPIDIRQLIDQQPIGRYQKWVVFLGFLIIALDGLDVAIIGFIAPQLKSEWQLGPQALGPVLSAALIGLALGALVAGPLADRYGRKAVLLGSVLLFGLWTLASAFSPNLETLVALRFLTGLGLGAAMPNASTLVSEYAPARSRSLLITLAFCGFSLGAAMGGFVSAWMIPNLGWRSVLALGCVLPLLVLPLLWLRLPESVTFLVSKGGDPQRIRAIVRRLAPGHCGPDSSFVLPACASVKGGAIGTILSSRYRFGTMMLWVGYVLALFLVYLFSGWLPTLVKEGGGFSVSEAAIVTACFQIGGPLGAITVGWAMDRWHPQRVLMLTFLFSGAVIFAIGQVAGHFAWLCAIAWAVGFGLNGASVGMNALAAGFYPTEARATGASWMSGIGRLGAILSAFAGAQMLAMGWSFSQVFAALLIPAGLAALAVSLQGWHARLRGSQRLQAI
ncbi:aromatic acid/H+ symport family MFS transporter [Pseudomonas sp. SWI44]|uniref:MFS transporter n=1 Tax=Pseudomonas sp. SWI44 TaxID=2083053 RepID=UPI000CE5EC3E|nr:aromatic acid/H+ symport family MFS transporter [Pseudomonas sp. SWI44]AVD90553.1 aromatic acid/H+ symport family MFS transporter [Pseudomonas sp. SWI44]